MGGPGNRIGQPLLGPGAGAPSAGGGSMDTTSPRVSFAPAPDTAVRVHPRRTSLNTDSTEAATDKQYGFAVTPRTPSQSTRLIFWLLGVGTLLPWNATLTAIDFFRMEYPTKGNPDLWFTGLFQVATMAVMIALVPLGALLVFRTRFVAGYFVYIVLLAGLPCLTFLADKSLSWILVLVAMPIFGAATGMVESSMYGYAALNSKFAVTFAQVGESSSGLLVSLLQIITKAVFPNTNRGTTEGAFVYFGLSALVCFACICIFFKVPWLRNDNTARDNKVDWAKARSAFSRNWRMCAGISLNYAISLAIFPGLIVSITPSLSMDENGWLPIILITLFNLGDSCGRLAANFNIHIKTPTQVLLFCASRVAFLPLFVLFVKGDIHNDFAAMAATLVLGLTNGFISVNCMLHGRRMVPLDAREEAGYILTLCMSIGITLGVVLALPVNYFWAGQSL